MNEEQNHQDENINEEIAPTPATENSTQVTFSKSTLKKAGIGGMAVVLAVAGFIFMNATKSDNRLKDAVVACDAVESSGVTLAEDNQSLTFNGKGDEDLFGGSTLDLVCFLEELSAPSTILTRMSNTNSLMGLQDASWEGISVSWSYHPNNGLDANFEILE